MPHVLEIAIIRTTSIGDVVLASAALNYLEIVAKNTGHQFKVWWIGRSPSLELIEKSYTGISVIYAQAKKSPHAIADKLKNCTFVLDLQVNPKI